MLKRKSQQIYLWESMCGVFQTKKSVKEFKNPEQLFKAYLKRQIKKKRIKYIVFCKEHQKMARAMAKKVYLLRRDGVGSLIDWDYIDMKA